MDKQIIYKPIGVIYSPFKMPKGTPIQPKSAKGIKGKVVINEEYKEGLKDLEGFSHIILIYHFHLIRGYSLIVKPYMDDNLHGVFATRAPKRPNAIGISVVKLLNIEGNVLEVEDVDIVDGTPLLDIKPYVPDFDIRRVEKIGWLRKVINSLPQKKDDGRFY
ncbi:MAG: tRNA (N6-threonylcarbamoyladenosine(37)-N6)-methyltransferase TrmO [Candidatus Omnitrophota bacterium]|nr:MAG: tRNA (N6-threonylcarbamoyladenosine(37)-N6)-methyltransferase TrmO [Candidatus Omnitrophota bacterium]RKY44340.1 MAG: tRNA (N6-threonylcarbamoyladenosine(37)-N6)-methyltransferase TrmO [Candidatus Omnitrophota bacterium]